MSFHSAAFRAFGQYSRTDSSNTDGSFTMAKSNSFLSPYEILPIAQENKHLGNFWSFYHEIVCCVYLLDRLIVSSHEYTHHTIIVVEDRKDIPKLSPFAI